MIKTSDDDDDDDLTEHILHYEKSKWPKYSLLANASIGKIPASKSALCLLLPERMDKQATLQGESIRPVSSSDRSGDDEQR